MKPKQLKQLYERFAYAEYMVADGCPRKDFLEKEEIDFLLAQFLQYLITSGQITAYIPEEE